MAIAVRELEGTMAPLPAARAIPAPLRALLPPLLTALRASAPAPSTRVGAMASYHLGWTDATGHPSGGGGGKFLRGTLALWAAERCGGRLDDALGVAAAVEWLHNFTLVHDDIQDGDRERRHRPTVWAVWGPAQGINAGDGMHAVAYRALLSGGGSPSARLRAAAAVNDAILTVIEGQCLDLALEGQIDTSAAAYLRLARAKTGALLGAALQAGALVGGAGVRQAARLRQAGVELGVAFQIRDDWLGIWGNTATTGKGRDGDLARRKLTYPVVVGHSLLRDGARREFRRLYRSGGGDEARILALLDEAGVSSAVALDLERRRRTAVALAESCALGDAAVRDFEEITDFIVDRVA